MHVRAFSVSFLTLLASLSPLLAAHTFTCRTGRSITADIGAKQGHQIAKMVVPGLAAGPKK